jgi:hypothetical protein
MRRILMKWNERLIKGRDFVANVSTVTSEGGLPVDEDVSEAITGLVG